MASEDSFFQTADIDRVWQRYCGFLDLSPDEFMQIQEHLLREQIHLIADSPLGREIMKGQKPGTVDEFRRLVPLSSYDDYVPYLSGRQEESLPRAEYCWIHTSAPQGTFKRIPWTPRFQSVQGRNVIAALILASAREKREAAVAPGLKVLAILPGTPFASASLAEGLAKEFPVQVVPPLDWNGNVPFRRKVDEGLRLALTTDIDFVIAMTSSLIRLGERFGHIVKDGKLPSLLTRLHPKVAWRLLRGQVRGSRHIMPREAWSVRGVIGWGADSDVFAGKIAEQWGKPLFQMYASSEGGIIALQESPGSHMAFLPDSVFLEFLPEEELERGEHAQTVLPAELEEGRLYEPVLTSFYGMPFLRYRQGDLVRIHRSSDRLMPRMVFHGRADDVIDLFGIARLNARTVSQALDLTQIDHGEWCLRKEYEASKPVLRLYVELDQAITAKEMAARFHRALGAADQHYREAVQTMSFNPVRVAPLMRGAFRRLGRQGASSRPRSRMNPPDSVVQKLLGLGEQVT